jgi:hypothetical protein
MDRPRSESYLRLGIPKLSLSPQYSPIPHPNLKSLASLFSLLQIGGRRINPIWRTTAFIWPTIVQKTISINPNKISSPKKKTRVFKGFYFSFLENLAFFFF